jgi:hypothetical protein
LGHRPGFAQEAVDILRAGADVAGAGDLDGDDAVQLGIAGLEDGAERAFAEELDDFELADAFVLGLVAGGSREVSEPKAGAAAGAGNFHQRSQGRRSRSGSGSGGSAGAWRDSILAAVTLEEPEVKAGARSSFPPVRSAVGVCGMPRKNGSRHLLLLPTA